METTNNNNGSKAFKALNKAQRDYHHQKRVSREKLEQLKNKDVQRNTLFFNQIMREARPFQEVDEETNLYFWIS